LETGKPFFVYILECENGNFYTGYTDDIARRFNVHKTGAKEGAKFTRSFKPSKVAAAWKIFGGKSAAMKVEFFIKKRSRSVKEKFISDPPSLKMEFFKKKETADAMDIVPEITFPVHST
jgi:putative endonuclease